jgi:hypothetical protein
MTPGQQAFADGFAANLATHGQTWTRTSDNAAIQGVPSSLRVAPAALVQAQDKDFAVVVADRALVGPLTSAQVMPVARVKKGDELTKGSRKYRVVSADLQESNLMWLVVLSPTF